MFRQWKDGTLKMVLISKAEKQDLDYVCSLERELILEELSRGVRGFLQILDLQSLTERVRNFYASRNLDFSATYTAKEEEIIGFIHGKIQNHPLTTPKRVGFVTSFFIKPEYRKKGIGKELYSEMEKWFKEKECAAIELDISEGNPAIEFYRLEGFENYLIKMVKKIG